MSADHLKPRDAAEVEQAIQWALADGKTLEVVGRGTKRAIGRAAQWDATLDLSGLSGVTLYEPEELVLSAKAGTPLAEIEALVAGSKQELAFEPMDYGPVLGVPTGAGTIGGAIAANLSGPRRIKAGAARDHFLGFMAVSGRGETFKSGGRVVKNVTGYDLCKLLAGSWGTLAAMTDVTVKTLPRAETEETVLVLNLDDAAAGKAMAAAMGSFARRLGGRASAGGRGGADRRGGECRLVAVTAFRLEGVAPSVAQRKGVLETLLAPFGALGALGEAASRALWRAIRDVTPFAANGPAGERDLWRISTAPTRGAEVGRALAEQADAELLYDWAGGLVWAALPPADDARAPLVRATRRCGGRPCDADPRAGRGARRRRCVHAEEPALAALTKRVRESFDPQRRAQCRPHVGGRVKTTRCRPLSRSRSLPIRTSRNRKKSCAPACIAAFAPRPARPTCSTATSSIRRAGASTSSRTCWSTTGRRRPRSSCTSIAACRASPA